MNKIDRMKMEVKISEKVRKDNGCEVRFEYDEYGTPGHLYPIQVTARTFNPKTGEIFVLTTATGDNERICLETIDKYIDTIKESESTFTVEWARKGDNALKHKSYFACIDVREVCDKFFCDKKKEEYIVYEIKMNPIA